mgnify:CR=1 FL=1
MTTKFTKDHEYISVTGPTGTVGITPYAQEQLGDIVFVELPEIGRQLKAGDEAAVVEAVGRQTGLKAQRVQLVRVCGITETVELQVEY